MLKSKHWTTKNRLEWLCFWFMACSLLFAAPTELMAFAAPIVTKANTIKDNLILIAKACVGIGIVIFVFSLIINRPLWKLCVCLLAVGVIVGAFSSFYGFIVT